MTVTLWHAKKFSELRAHCGVSEDSFSALLARCDETKPSGGKSSAAFWVTRDQRFLLKELVSARVLKVVGLANAAAGQVAKWGVSECESFVAFAPAFIDHLMDDSRPSLLAKIFGCFTVKTRNLDSGVVTKRHVIVQENLFYGRSISRVFDMKGIATRAAKARDGDSSAKTGWDADWLGCKCCARPGQSGWADHLFS